jgi:hypothetical protein
MATSISSELGLQPLRCTRVLAKGRERKRECGGPISSLTEGRAAMRWPSDGGEGRGGENSGAGSLRAWNWGKEEQGRSGGRRGYRGTLLLGWTGKGRLGDGGELVATVERHDGCGGGRFRRGSARAVVGSDEGGGLLQSFQEQKRGRREAVRTLAREAASGIRPMEEDDRAGPTRQ